jgi:DNA-binding NarL/FixJ family response regulator
MSNRVLIVDDHVLLGQSLQLALSGEGFEVRVVDGPTADAIVGAAEAFHPTLVLLDLDLGEQLGSSLGLIDRLLEAAERVVILTGNTDKRALGECLEAGADGILKKSVSFDRLVQSIRDAVEGRDILPPGERHEMRDALRAWRSSEARRKATLERLTEREQQVLAGLVDGRSAAEIAEMSFVSLATVRSQIRSILLKLDVSSQLQAVALARRQGWFDS